jgi:hypothetical protein
MPTDGADFARRRPLYGQFYVALKNGADVARWIGASRVCIARCSLLILAIAGHLDEA